MENSALADRLVLLSKLMEIHGENSFKAKAYANAAFAIENFPRPLSDLSLEKIEAIKGVGESAAKKIEELLQTGELNALNELLVKTPAGVADMMQIKGLGAKKIHSIWKGLDINSIEALQKACEQGFIAQQKGFGEKTQQNILEAIAYRASNKGKFLYIHAERIYNDLQKLFFENIKSEKLEASGALRRQMDVIESIDIVTTAGHGVLKKFAAANHIEIQNENSTSLDMLFQDALVRFHIADESNFGSVLFQTTGHEAFVTACEEMIDSKGWAHEKEEHGVFKKLGLPFIHPALRENGDINYLKQKASHKLIEAGDVKGLIHAHSKWSDGSNTIEEMAIALKERGFEYLVLSDHSKAAFYANGLSELRITEQHREIDRLNQKLAPFKIFKSIECDILNDGNMDYGHEVLKKFDIVIASVHSNLQMTEEKAMQRLQAAVANPYVSILGHATGRLLLKRKGYPVDHPQLIAACKKYNVVIEINANPLRLDIDWRWVKAALEAGLLLSINPDAHAIAEYDFIQYGVLAAQKGGLQKAQNLSSFSLEEFETFLKAQHQKRPLV